MSTMRELVPEYREAAARIAMRIAEKKAAGASNYELASLREALQDIRNVQRLMDGYYEIPRPDVVWKVRNSNDDS